MSLVKLRPSPLITSARSWTSIEEPPGMGQVLHAIGRLDLDPLETYLSWDAENVRLHRGSAHHRYREGAAGSSTTWANVSSSKELRRT
ncbi:MAG: hypothetical protein ACREM6_07390, partial [Vulcanimicrobiaceae bacterium]